MRVPSYFDIYPELKRGSLKLVDLRSPCEFLDGAMPHAINVPLFTDAERAEVGTLYKQAGAVEATSLGLEFVAAKIDNLLETLSRLANQEQKIVVHCWRGGQRSGAIGMLLKATGFNPLVIQGGYKKYRQDVLTRIESLASRDLMILNGRTGSGKTKLLRELMDSGVPGIDFEGLAAHRGSALGDFNMNRAQPTQQNFENLLANAYEDMKHAPVILAEIEQDLGRIRMPQNLRRKIYDSPMILLERNMTDRVEHLVTEYTTNWTDADDEKLLARMLLLKPHLQGPVYNEIIDKMRARSFQDAVELLLRHRYDRCYDKGLLKQARRIIAKINVSDGWENSKKSVREIMARP
jgi:tRNA 2-selenouridine synthase